MKILNKGHIVTEKTRIKIRKARAKQILPTEYTSIENKIYERLLQLNLAGYFERNELIGKFHRFDFVSQKFKIAIETDGDYWHSNPKIYTQLDEVQKHNKKNDKVKNKLINENDYLLLRFWESDINKDMENIGYYIFNCCNRGEIS